MFEKEIANDIKTLGSVKVDIKFLYGAGGTRPTDIIYNVFDNSGKKILTGLFGN